MATKDNLKKDAKALLDRKQLQAAKELYIQICHLDEQDAEAWVTLSALHGALHSYDKAEEGCRRALRIRPDFAEAYHNLGNALKAQGQKVEAVACFREATRCNPEYVNAYHSMGNVLRDLMRHDEAVASFEQALRIAPNHAPVHYDLGNAFKAQGKISEAVASFRRALTHKPDFRLAHGNVVACLNYDPTADVNTTYEEHVRWGRAIEAEVAPDPRHSNTVDPDRRLRIGYISRDFRAHSVAYFFEALLSKCDPEAVENVCYSDVACPDAMTGRLRSLAQIWRDTRDSDDAHLEAMIWADRIDILVDLAGHTTENRLAVFARKPAPIQVSYLGYPNTTGLSRMDYRLTDAWADPPGKHDRYYTETLIRLPNGFVCYTPDRGAPPVTALPASRTGSVTFGSFNNSVKITPEVVATWAAILRAVPGSRMLCKAYWFADPSIRERYHRLFEINGVGRECVLLRGQLPEARDHLSVYADVDIALDTFPYNGTTTTCEALWMGVPVVVLAGDRHAGRVGVSLMHQAGLTELVAGDVGSYVAKAAGLARDLHALNRMRAELRPRMSSSLLCDESRLVNDVQAAYRAMWKQWCKEREN